MNRPEPPPPPAAHDWAGAPPLDSRQRVVLGVVHLRALPGSPNYTSRADVRTAAESDAAQILSGGMSGLVVENFGDVPFGAGPVEPIIITEMTALVRELRHRYPEAILGVNVLRNDACGALAIAAAAGADFIRVNILTGEMITDQGRIGGDAAAVARHRRNWDAPVRVWADVAVKHATPPAGFDLAQSAKDTAYRGLADGLIVTGSGTGVSTSSTDLSVVCDAVPDRPVWIGSGLTVQSAASALSEASGAIVGTSLKRDGNVHAPVELDRVQALVAAIEAAGFSLARRQPVGRPKPRYERDQA